LTAACVYWWLYALHCMGPGQPCTALPTYMCSGAVRGCAPLGSKPACHLPPDQCMWLTELLWAGLHWGGQPCLALLLSTHITYVSRPTWCAAVVCVAAAMHPATPASSGQTLTLSLLLTVQSGLHIQCL
jgi:hypothetical protein